MYEDSEKLDQFKQIWLTKESNSLILEEKERLKKREKRKVSKGKIVNNLILEKYGHS